MNEFLSTLNIETSNKGIHFNMPNSFYIEETVKRGLGKLSKDGALVVNTGKFTGRAAKDKYVVKSDRTKDSFLWENDVIEMTPDNF